MKSRMSACTTFLLFFVTNLLTYVGGGGRPPECTWAVDSVGVTASGVEGLRADCTVRTLLPELLNLTSNSSISAIGHASHITALNIKCSKQVVFESEIQPRMFVAFPRLQTLFVNTCKITEIPDGALAGLSQLQYLSIHSHHEDWPGASLILQKNSLQSLSRLELLDLAYNNLWTLPPTLLCQLPSLVFLNLTHNQIHHISDLGISNTDTCILALMHLNFSFNEINEVPQKALTEMRDLRTLDFSYNKIAHIADWAFTGLPELSKLDLSNNKLVAFPLGVFSDLHQLLELSVSNNSIGVLPPNIFYNLNQLLTLQVSFNQIKFDAKNNTPFSGLIRLVVLDLSFNNIDSLVPTIFKDLYSLQILNMSHNKLLYLEDFVFKELSNLHTLDISFNNIETISSKSFYGLAVLAFLYLNENQISEMQDNFLDDCSSLQKINLSNNLMSVIPVSVARASLLKKLFINNNQISALQEEHLRGLVHLTELQVSHNEISNISRLALLEIPEIKKLDLSYNSLESIVIGTFDGVKNLEELTITHNSLADINGIATYLQKLKYFNVSNNMIIWFDFALIPKSLQWLDISYNFIQRLENYYSLQDQLELKTLYATHNNISEINSISFPHMVEKIYLSDNSISYIASNTFLDKKFLVLIDLRRNNLAILEEAAMRLSPRNGAAANITPQLLLSENPLECDCGSDWLIHAASGVTFAGSLLPKLSDASSVMCQLPGVWNRAVVPLLSVQPQQFLCTYRRHCFTLCHCCDFDACDCEQTCPRNCTCYHDSTWSHNVVDCGEGGWVNVPNGVPMDVTEAFIDGNDIVTLSSHSLIGRKNLRVLYLNNSHIITIQNRTFNGLKNLQVLKLDHNDMINLNGYEFAHLNNLLELDLSYNKLSYISNITFAHLRSLEILKLHNNKIYSFPVWNLALNPFLLEISLHENLWSCDCSFLANLRAWLEANRIKTLNATLIRCWHNVTQENGPFILSDDPIRCDHYVSPNQINDLILQDYVMLGSISASLILLILGGIMITIACRKRLKLWVCSRKRYLENAEYLRDQEKLFDSYVGHSVKDTAWVCGVLAPELEARGYVLCVAQRDCAKSASPLSGDAIRESIECSRRVILVISRNFIDSEWCKYEFKSAHVDVLLSKCRRKNVIIIFLENLSKSEIDKELNDIIKFAKIHLYLRHPKFWEKLQRALSIYRYRRKGDSNNRCIKAVSQPLVMVENLNGPLLSRTIKTSNNGSSKSLTVNPFWETSIMNGVADSSDVSWMYCPALKTAHAMGPASHSTKDDHTYMSVVDCNTRRENVLLQNNCENGLGEKGAMQLPLHFRQDTPDYLTKSWIFHPSPNEPPPPPPPGQTYFV